MKQNGYCKDLYKSAPKSAKMQGMKISYREVKRRQLEDFRTYPKENLYNIYRHFSTPFTYLSLRLGITPNQITIIYFFSCILGGIFLAFGTYPCMLLGVLFFLIFKVLDDSDGEVARIQKSHSIEGVYLDRIGHYIYSLSFGIGLGVGMERLYGNILYALIGFLFTFVIIIEHSVIDLLKSTLRQKVIEESFGKKLRTERVHRIDMTRMVNEGRSFSELSIFSKIFSIYPIQGLFYSEHIYTLAITFLILGEYLLNLLGFPFVVNSFVFGFVLPLYISIIVVSKSVWLIGFVYRLNRTRYITKF